jgi:hypothetical protein
VGLISKSLLPCFRLHLYFHLVPKLFSPLINSAMNFGARVYKNNIARIIKSTQLLLFYYFCESKFPVTLELQ